jgi:hypothetical protein
MYRDTTNLKHKIYDFTGNNWSYRDTNGSFEEKFRSHTRKTFDRFSTKTAMLGATFTIREVLQSETRNVSGGDHRWLNRRSTGEELACGKKQCNN